MATNPTTTSSISSSLAQLIKDAEQSAQVIKLAIADNLVTEKQGQDQLLAQQRTFQEQRLVLAQRQAEQLKAILASATDPDKQKDINAKLLKAEGTVTDARLAIARSYAQEAEAGRRAEAEAIKQQLQRREAEEKAALERIELANRESDARITQSQQQRILAVKQQQLAGTKTAEEAAQAIAQIEQSGIAETVQARQAELAEVIRLRDTGVINAQEARDRELSLNEEVGQLNLRRIDSEIQAQERARVAALKAIEDQKKATIAAIEAAAATQTAPLEARKIQLDIGNSASDVQSNLLSAQLEQQQAIAQVEQTRYDTAIQRAQLAGNEAQADQLKLQQLQAQQAATVQEFEIQRQQLALSQEQRAIDLERQAIAADIAAIEAEVAVQKAIANGASQQEIDNLQKILGLRQKQVEQVRSAEQQQSKLNALETNTLAAEQANEQAKGQLSIDRQRGATAADQGKRGTAAGAAARLSAEELERQRIANGQRYGFNASGSSLQQLRVQPSLDLAALKPITDLSGLSSVVEQGNGQVVGKLDQLNQSIQQLANTPRCISVSAPDPVGAVGRVLSDVGKASFRRAKL